MGVLIGEGGVTRFSYLEYQALILCLALVTCAGWICIELAMKRFQVLPVLFPGMFSVRERRFYFFDFEVMDGNVAGRIRCEAKHLVHMTLFLVMSYLWQRCVLETSQQVGTDFPTQFCNEGYDCFASELHYSTLLTRDYTPVDCTGPGKDFTRKVVVSCIHFVKPSATMWLMHVAIAHSLTQMHFKVYEVMVWVAGHSRCVRRIFGLLVALSLFIFLGLFFGGVMLEFVSSWLSFVMSLSMPVFLHTVWRSGEILEELWQAQAKDAQQSMEEHFKQALTQLPDVPLEDSHQEERIELVTASRLQMARNLLRMPMPSLRRVKLPSLGSWSSDASARPRGGNSEPSSPVAGGPPCAEQDVQEERELHPSAEA